MVESLCASSCCRLLVAVLTCMLESSAWLIREPGRDTMEGLHLQTSRLVSIAWMVDAPSRLQ